ncbi:MAG: LysR family transcriptional regulator [Opitutae bacterium]|nr:LysR family transcriptional regulator [Opitutae bacterium]
MKSSLQENSAAKNFSPRISSLKIFCDLAASGSFSKAAEQNGMTQPAVSNLISALEKNLGFSLIDRTLAKFALTPEGQIFQKRAGEIYTQFLRTKSELQNAKNVVAGTLKIAAVYSVGVNVLPRVMRKFMAENPKVSLSVCYDTASGVVEKVAGGSVELGIISGDRHSRSEEMFPLYEEPLVAICAPANTISRQRDTSLAELATFPFFSYSESVFLRRQIEQIFKAGNIDCTPAKFFDNVEILKCAVEINAGVAIVPAYSVGREISAGTLVALPLRDQKISRTVSAIVRKGYPVTPAIRRFMDLATK